MIRKTDAETRREHEAVRNGVGFYDFTHEMIEVTGLQMGEFLDRIFANSMADLPTGKAKYTQMLNDDGIIIDDVIIFKVSDDAYWITTLYVDQMKEIFDTNITDYDAAYQDVTADYVMYVVQGPKSRDVINGVVEEAVDNLPWFSIMPNKIDDMDVHVSRAGYTGELGYEIYADASFKEAIESRIKAAGEPFDIVEITTDAKLSSLPREKGYVLMSDVGGMNPIDAGFAWAVAWDTDFIGKEALAKAKEAGSRRALLGFVLDSDDDEVAIDAGDDVMVEGEIVGQVTAVTYGYTVEKYIGYAVVDASKVGIGDRVTINDYAAELTKRAFYDVKNTRLTQ
ncbi:aminomethyltransferase family protein [Fundicoccus culcitae]|uniref:Aminomethyltransferase family protein n=1 Tax=Fundicoccus culcitae TaxID=2969821 RepID=A0ABY5P4A3_9LACT|nr:aminomethyltransferase family protein [Fundicoccus culcitae]UUX33579.1 aminomethyltransferase family protein [Fundicoccus culcitae]